MWWSEPGHRAGPRRARPALVAALLLALAACGFRPLHLPPDSESAARSDALAKTLVRPIEGRPGQQLHNLLRDRLNPEGQPARPAYLLEVELTKTVRESAIQTDETATRANLFLEARYTVRDAGTRLVLFRGEVLSVNGFNILNALYATRTAEEGALRRALADLADSLRQELAARFAKPQSAGTP